MKEIKFKAYIKDLKKVVDVYELDFKNKFVKFLINEKEKFELRMFDQVELLQFTGLKGKNGKEIYEGDIIRLGTGKIRFVFYGVTSFRNKYTKEFNYQNTGYEVIGNKYDNPELLEVEE